jgi:hypothetical protein
MSNVWQTACPFEPIMCSSNIESTRCYLFHEEFLLKLHRIVNEKRPKTPNLVIGDILKDALAELNNNAYSK